MKNNIPEYSINLNNLKLVYEVYHDKTNSLKEFIVNFFTRKKYVDKRHDTLDALNNLNIYIQEGERVGIIGHNGAGKSTLLKVISGILKPTSGYIEINGSVQPLIEVGAGFDHEFTGRENIYLNSYMLGFTKAQVKAKEQSIIDFADLGHFIDTPVKYYSSGMNVRLAFSIATSIEPEILILDEMLSAGDQSFMIKAKQKIDSLVNKAKIIVVVSHDLKFIENMCNRCLLMKNGKIVMDGNPRDVITHYVSSSNNAN